ncbi:MAG: tetratricopeptide repeat protein [Lachnospiraceae bacterium]|nr:tetratricopeptide repeat protein [Lachnospiraceae bacterium]
MKNKKIRKWSLLVLAAAVLTAVIFTACSKKKTGQEESQSQESKESNQVSELLLQGMSYAKEEDYDQAIETFLKCIELDKTSAKAYFELASAYMAVEEYELAGEALENGYAATQNEKLKEAWINCLETVSGIYMEQEDYELAIDWLNKYIEQAGESTETLLSLSTAYSMMDEYELAVQTLERADSENEAVRQALMEAKLRYGELCYDEGESEKAVAILKEVLEMNPNAIEAYSLLVSTYMESGKLGDAKALVEQGLDKFLTKDAAVDGEKLEVFLNVASGYYAELDDMDACLAFWEKAVAVQPDNKTYREELAGYRSMAADNAYAKGDELLDRGDVNGASAHYRQAFALSPDNFEPGIISMDKGTYCLNRDGSFKLGWHEDEVGGRYYFSSEPGPSYAAALTGWQQLDGAFYCFEDDGLMMVDDTTPDGRYVGLDGKLAEGNPFEDEEPDETEEPDDDETEAPDDETTASWEQETDEATQPSKEGSQPSAAYSGSLKLNADAVQEARSAGGSVSLKREELFFGGDEQITMADVYDCLNQYGVKTEWLSEHEPYELKMGEMKIWILPGDTWTEKGLIVKDAASYGEAVRKKKLPEEVQFVVEFPGTESETLDLDKIRRINNK